MNTSFVPFILVTASLSILVSCQTTPYAPPPQQAKVETIKVAISDFHGRPDIVATIQGNLSSNAAQLVDVKQSRGPGNVLIVEVREQTPRGGISTNKIPNPPFQTRVPLEVLGLEPNRTYVVDANGVRTEFTMPGQNDNAGYLTSSSSTGLEVPTDS